VSGAQKASIENNIIHKTGINPGVSDGGVGDLQAIRVWDSFNTSIQDNIIDSTGYNGMTFNTTGGTIIRNIVTNTLLSASDGGALYAWSTNSNNIVIQNNIVENVWGNMSARPAGKTNIKGGIYLDNGVHHCQVLNNTVVSTGIYTNAGTNDNAFIGNTIYRSEFGLKASDWYSGASIYNLISKRNVFYTNTSNGIPLLLQSNDDNYIMFTELDSNYYCNPYLKTEVRYDWSKPNSYELLNWKTLSGKDKATKKSFNEWVFPVDSSFILINKTVNSVTHNFTEDVRNLDNVSIKTITLPPFSGQVLIKANKVVEDSNTGGDSGGADDTNDTGDGGTEGNNTNTSSINLEVFPNPASSQIRLKCDYQVSEVVIADRFGNIAMRVTKKNIKSMDVSSLNTGTYFLFGNTSQGPAQAVRLIKE
jgi:hypothetical protein